MELLNRLLATSFIELMKLMYCMEEGINAGIPYMDDNLTP
jgi:hypothetical protein